MTDTTEPTEQYERVLVGINEPVYPALADRSQRWNGFLAAPWFSRETAEQIATDLNDYVTTHLTIDDEGVWVAVADYADEYDDSRGDLAPWNTGIDGVPRAAVGAFSWMWSEISDPS